MLLTKTDKRLNETKLVTQSEQKRCPHCGRLLNPDERITYKFSRWATSLVVVILSLMLFALDLVDNGDNISFANRVEWSIWAILGLWLFYISVQLVRYQPYYTWLMIPISGVLFSVFLFALDLVDNGDNDGFAGTDWAFYAIIPIITFVVILPIAARVAREQPTHYDRLDYLVEHLAEDTDD